MIGALCQVTIPGERALLSHFLQAEADRMVAECSDHWVLARLTFRFEVHFAYPEHGNTLGLTMKTLSVKIPETLEIKLRRQGEGGQRTRIGDREPGACP